MDIASMILAFAMQNPQSTSRLLDAYVTPGQINAEQLNGSLADFAQEALTCYHPSARFRGVEVVATPWEEQDKYGAEGSVVMRIRLVGFSGTPYEMLVAAMVKGASYRTFVVDENTLVRYNKKCQLERWTSVSSP